MTTQADNSPKYTMKISRLTIDKLGIHMYDRVSAVMAELIANSYDADATEVTITLPFGKYLAKRGDNGQAVDLHHEVSIEDNGIGMLHQEVNDYYLKVGLNRRSTRGETTPNGRLVFGRKGIGKLAPFGICREIEVTTAGGSPDGDGNYEVSNLVLRYDEILSDDDDDYHPEPGPSDGSKRSYSGTTITLRQFERRRVPPRDTLHRQVSARFGISRPDWQVRVINLEDTQDAFLVGELDVPLMDSTKICVDERPVLVKTPDDDGVDRITETLPVSGWVAYSKEPYKDEAMAGVRVFARGKLVAQTRDFDIGAGFTGEYKMRSYVVGAVHADWLDDADDLIRSDRQGIIWTSERGEALQRWGILLLKELAGRSEPVIELFEKASIVEMYSLGQVARERIEAVQMLRSLVSSTTTLEGELQQLVERAPWILYPDWTPLTQNEPLNRLRIAFETWYKKTQHTEIITTTIGSPRREPDFVMLNFEGRIEVVEIKRPGHGLTDDEYLRAFGYLTAVTKFLEANEQLGSLFPKVRLTIVCDRLGLTNPVNSSSIENEDRIVRKSWEAVLHGTMQAHQDFLGRVNELQGRLPIVPLLRDEEDENNGHT